MVDAQITLPPRVPPLSVEPLGSLHSSAMIEPRPGAAYGQVCPTRKLCLQHVDLESLVGLPGGSHLVEGTLASMYVPGRRAVSLALRARVAWPLFLFR